MHILIMQCISFFFKDTDIIYPPRNPVVEIKRLEVKVFKPFHLLVILPFRQFYVIIF